MVKLGESSRGHQIQIATDFGSQRLGDLSYWMLIWGGTSRRQQIQIAIGFSSQGLGDLSYGMLIWALLHFACHKLYLPSNKMNLAFEDARWIERSWSKYHLSSVKNPCMWIFPGFRQVHGPTVFSITCLELRGSPATNCGMLLVHVVLYPTCFLPKTANSLSCIYSCTVVSCSAQDTGR